MFQSDAIFKMGQTHTECEDYALAGEVTRNKVKSRYAIVCDGCSASNAVSLGARLLAFGALDSLVDLTKDNPFESVGWEAINTAWRARSQFAHLNLDSSILDATLLVAYTTDPARRDGMVHAYGDGVIVRRMFGRTFFWVINYESGAPYYLVYKLSQLRDTAYQAEFTGKKWVTQYELKPDGKCEPVDKQEVNLFLPFQLPFHFEEPGDYISLMSDGALQFSDGTGTRMPPEVLIPRLTAYKNFAGQFVSRRVEFFLRGCQKDGITFADDLSVATIAWTKDE